MPSQSSMVSQMPSLSSRQISMASLSEQSRAPNVFSRQNESFNSYVNTTEDLSRQTSFSSYGDRNVVAMPPTLLVRIPHSRNVGSSSNDPWEGFSRSSHSSSPSVNFEDIANSCLVSVANYAESEAGSLILPSINEPEKEHTYSPPNHDVVGHMNMTNFAYLKGKINEY